MRDSFCDLNNKDLGVSSKRKITNDDHFQERAQFLLFACKKKKLFAWRILCNLKIYFTETQSKYFVKTLYFKQYKRKIHAQNPNWSDSSLNEIKWNMFFMPSAHMKYIRNIVKATFHALEHVKIKFSCANLRCSFKYIVQQ